MCGAGHRRDAILRQCVRQYYRHQRLSYAVFGVRRRFGQSISNLEYFGFFAATPVLSHQLIPGNTYYLQSLANEKFVTAPNGGTNALIAQSTSVGLAEEFKVVDQGGGNISLLALVNSQYVCADNDGASPLIANRPSAGSWETYTGI